MADLQTAPGARDDVRRKPIAFDPVGLVLTAAAAVVMAFYVSRIFSELPLYGGDEGSYLIRALFGREMAADPTLAPRTPEINNSVFLAILAAIGRSSEHFLGWIRLLGAAAYVAGLVLVYKAVEPHLPKAQGLGFLLLALVFPYYRFVVTALPEGWYVGVLGLLVYVTARLYGSRPALHAVVAGALTAVLTLLKPHGVAVVAAFAALAVIEAVLAGGKLRLMLVRLAAFAASFLGAGNLIQVLAHQKVADPLLFYQGAFYSGLMAMGHGPYAVSLTLLAAIAMTAGVLILAAVPIVCGGWRFARRWLDSAAAGGLHLEPPEPAFLLVLLSLAATLVMVTIFSWKATAAGPDEVRRLVGRYFEFFVPMLWLTAAPFIVEGEARFRREWRIACCALVLAGLGGLLFAFYKGLVLLPWDATALTAFALPDVRGFPLPTRIPYRALAVAATLAAALLMLTRLRVTRTWQAYFVVLALLSTGLDRLWERAMAGQRRELAEDLQAARTILAARPGPAAGVVEDDNVSRTTFLWLQGRPHMIDAAPQADIPAEQLAPYHTVLIQGRHRIAGGTWREIFQGRQLSVFEPGSP